MDFKERRAFIHPSKRGDVARIYFYLTKTYDIPLSKQENKVMNTWSNQDPIDAWEEERFNRILKIKDNNGLL